MAGMNRSSRRATIYLDPELHRALRIKAAETESSLSDLVNDAVRESLAEDAEDLATFKERIAEPNLPFEEVVRDLRQRGRI
jgi:predicted transcriptional regulator